ncbi:MAG: adenosylhomocysteinase [Gracilibacteraceae bacterium]|jgi:adenosylhomocysteinase|nr:adenosylhomocysteinase [Gracilibacteraceae bacterium]
MKAELEASLDRQNEDAQSQSTIRDIALAPAGQKKIDWARRFMPVLGAVRDDFISRKPFAGKRLTLCLHLEAKTAWLALVCQEGGAQVTVAASNPLSTQDDVVAALVANGVRAHAWYGVSDDEYERHLHLALDTRPDLIIDDGGDLVSLLHTTRRELLPGVLGGAEETTTGVLRLKAMDREGSLVFPMIAVNDARSKFLFDNRYGTGQSVWDALLRTTNLMVAGKKVCVVGYGWCGKGVALRARGLGAQVVVCEVDAVKANEALMDGHEVMPILRAAAEADFFITVTGNKNVIGGEHFAVMRDGAVLANAGHFDVEIDKRALGERAVTRSVVRPNVEQFVLPNGHRINLLAEGRLVNLAAGDGHPIEVMDMSFALQALAVDYVCGHKLDNRLYAVPEEIDDRVARMRLESLNCPIDTLSEAQKAYLESWQ